MALNAIRTSARNAEADGFCDQCDIGSTDPTGDIQIASSGFAAVLAELAGSNTFFGNALVGVCTAATISDDTSADNTGTAAVGRFRDRDNNLVAQFTAGTSGTDLILNTVSITSGDRVAITSATITAPAS